jgi:RIO kinase 2
MVRNVAGEMAELEPEDFPEYATLTREEVDYRLDRCLDRELIQRKTIQYEGYQLTFEGYDALALRTFSERGTIDGVGSPLGLGKEGDVYEVRSFRPHALKYHREGYTNFREVNREREYTADRDHVSWLYTSTRRARRPNASTR